MADETPVDSESVRLIEALVSQRTPRAAARTNNTDSGAKDSPNTGESAKDGPKTGESAEDGPKTGGSAEDRGPIKLASKKLVSTNVKPVSFDLLYCLKLKELIYHGLLSPGENVLGVCVKDTLVSFSLDVEGGINRQDHKSRFKSLIQAVRFAFKKCKVKETQHFMNGWLMMQYQGRSLAELRRALSVRKVLTLQRHHNIFDTAASPVSRKRKSIEMFTYSERAGRRRIKGEEPQSAVPAKKKKKDTFVVGKTRIVDKKIKKSVKHPKNSTVTAKEARKVFVAVPTTTQTKPTARKTGANAKKIERMIRKTEMIARRNEPKVEKTGRTTRKTEPTARKTRGKAKKTEPMIRKTEMIARRNEPKVEKTGRTTRKTELTARKTREKAEKTERMIRKTEMIARKNEPKAEKTERITRKKTKITANKNEPKVKKADQNDKKRKSGTKSKQSSQVTGVVLTKSINVNTRNKSRKPNRGKRKTWTKTVEYLNRQSSLYRDFVQEIFEQQGTEDTRPNGAKNTIHHSGDKTDFKGIKYEIVIESTEDESRTMEIVEIGDEIRLENKIPDTNKSTFNEAESAGATNLTTKDTLSLGAADLVNDSDPTIEAVSEIHGLIDGTTMESFASGTVIVDGETMEMKIMSTRAIDPTDSDVNPDQDICNCMPKFSSFSRSLRASTKGVSKNLDPFTIITCEKFQTTRTSQPFKVTVESNVLLSMDIHCHLATTEVIGYLAGYWNSESLTMSIQKAYPCRAIETADGLREKSVEMDPLSETEVKEQIDKLGMCVLGWYHSHPVFRCQPSVRDVSNQENYQKLFRDDASNEPFIGFIVAPFARAAINSKQSQICCFWVSTSPEPQKVHGSPMMLEYEIVKSDELSRTELNEMRLLLEYYDIYPTRQKMLAPLKKGDETKNLDGLLYLDQLILSLSAKLPRSFDQNRREKFFQFLRSNLEQADILQRSSM